MSAIKEMFDTFSALKDKDSSVTKRIEAIMLHARARQMQHQKRSHILFSVLISLATRLLIGFFGFLAAPYFQTLRFLASSGAAVAAFALSDLWAINPLYAAVCAYLAVYVLSNLKSTMNFLRASTFDVFDILLLGTITKLFSTIIINGGKNGSEVLLATQNRWYQPTPIAYHFYESRHPGVRDRYLSHIEEKFLTLAVDRPNDEYALRECDKYWSESREQPG